METGLCSVIHLLLDSVGGHQAKHQRLLLLSKPVYASLCLREIERKRERGRRGERERRRETGRGREGGRDGGRERQGGRGRDGARKCVRECSMVSEVWRNRVGEAQEKHRRTSPEPHE